MPLQPLLAPESIDLVWFRGADALRFLNDLVSQEIGDMDVGEARRSLLLGPEGKLDHIIWVIRAEDGYGLVTDAGRGEALANTLGRYRIRVEVDIEQEQSPVWVVMGEVDGYDISWRDTRRRLIVGPKPDLAVMGKDEYEKLRIVAGEPRFGVDVDGGTIPQETGLVPGTVDFTKGCYLGQELVARIDSRGGNVPRHLRVVAGTGSVEVGAAVMFENSEVGTVTSAADTLGLALLKRTALPGVTVRVGDTDAVVKDPAAG